MSDGAAVTGDSRVSVTIREAGGFIAILLALGGLLSQVRDHETRIEKVERQQDEDHDRITEMKAGIDYLVDRAKKEPAR